MPDSGTSIRVAATRLASLQKFQIRGLWRFHIHNDFALIFRRRKLRLKPSEENGETDQDARANHQDWSRVAQHFPQQTIISIHDFSRGTFNGFAKATCRPF